MKWLGIIIGGLVGLVLLIVLLVLLVPIRYKVSGRKYESASAKVRVSWLLHLVRFNVDWDGGREIATRLKILFFTVMDSTKDENGDVESEENCEAPENVSEPEQLSGPAKPESGAGKTADIQGDFEPDRPMLTYEDTDVILEKNGQGSKEDLKRERREARVERKLLKADARRQKIEAGKLAKAEKKKAKAERENGPAEKKKKKHRLRNALLKTKNKIDKLFAGIRHTYEKLKRKVDLIKEFIEDRRHKAAIALCRKTVVKVLKAIAPRSGEGRLRIGMEDPATTGYITAGLAVLYGKLKGRLKVFPDFEESVIEGEGKIKGRIFLITLLVLFLKLWFNKNFKALKSDFSELKENLSYDGTEADETIEGDSTGQKEN